MAGTDKSQQTAFRPGPAIILCEPQLGENIGTAARAIGYWNTPAGELPLAGGIARACVVDRILKLAPRQSIVR